MMRLYVCERGVPSGGGKHYNRPGYLAIVRAPDGWDSALRPLSPSCMRKDVATILWRQDYTDSRYSGPRSGYGQAWVLCNAEMRRITELGDD